MSAVSLVQISTLDLSKFLTIGRQALGRDLADSADRVGCDPPLHHLLCISALKNAATKSAADVSPYLNLFHAGFLIAVDERDCAEILEVAAMPSSVVESQARGICLLFVSGTIEQWANAIQRSISSTHEVQQIYSSVLSEFKNIGLGSAFKCQKRLN